MIYKFKSKAAGDLIMLGPQGDQLLRLLGREPAAKGIVEVAAMPAAIAALQAAVAADEAAPGLHRLQAIDEQSGRTVALRQRVWPMVEMLQRALAAAAAGRLGRLNEPRTTRRGHTAMKLWSDSWTNGDRIPERYGAGRLADGAGVAFSDNLNPHLAWSDVPAAAKSMVLICHDFDVPSRADDVNQPGPRSAGRPAARRLLPLGAGRPAAAPHRDRRR